MKIMKKNQLAVVMGVAFMASMSIGQVFAQNSAVVTNQLLVESVKVQSNATGRLVQVGTPVAAEPLKGFAKDLPLVAVLRQITPDGWVVKKNDNMGQAVQVQKLVSWEGGKSWVETLETIAVQNGLDVLVNWKKREVVVGQSNVSKIVSRVVAVQKEGVFELETNDKNAELTRGNSQQAVKPEVKVVVAAPVVETWNIKAGSSLKENVTQMAQRAGYKVVWNGEDYPADDDRVLTGGFDAENGPIKQLSIDYGPKSRAQQPLSFVFFQNHTLVVENWRFEQAGTPQYIKRD
jgi:hypothetical protein